jgi:Predicted divalent heavy-metal cations transporter
MDVLTLIFTMIVCGFVSLIGGFMLLKESKFAYVLQKWAVPFAAGSLLAAAFLDLIPEALEGGDDPINVLAIVLVGFLTFFVFGYILNLFHRHGHESAATVHSKKAASMMMTVDLIHTFIDGVVIGVSFLAGPTTGIISAIVVVAHEIPQEIGDFAVMIKSGLNKKRIIVIQILQATTLLPGALLAYFLGDRMMNGLPVILALTAGFFVHIAASEIIPSMQKERSRRVFYREIIGTVAGSVVIWALILLTHSH